MMIKNGKRARRNYQKKALKKQETIKKRDAGKARNRTGGRTHYGIESSILRRRDSSPLIHHAHQVVGNYRHLNHPRLPCIFFFLDSSLSLLVEEISRAADATFLLRPHGPFI